MILADIAIQQGQNTKETLQLLEGGLIVAGLLLAFITVFVESANHTAFHNFFKMEEAISEVHRISGDGCFLLTAHFTSNEEMEELLERILEHGNYRINLSIGKLKS